MQQKLPAKVERTRAAQYLRMSTEYQSNSPVNQADAIAEYAQARNFEIVRTYEDSARSGLTISGRPALKQMIQDVVSGAADYHAILVYDVSRWGRFQDIDESAHYEFLCRQMGIALHYCAEPFENDGSGVSSLLKNMKRVMAAEYSRDLARRIRAGQVRIAASGFRVGGSAPYGYQRLLVDKDGHAKSLLIDGQRKSMQTDRVLTVPGLAEEVAVVRRIFDLYVGGGLGGKQIARALNAEGIRTRAGAKWRDSTIATILKSEAYLGTSIFGRSRKHGPKRDLVRCPPDTWVRCENAAEGIVSSQVFRLAQDLRRHRHPRPGCSNAELLAHLEALLDKHGKFARRLAIANPDSFFCSTYRSRFGSMSEAFRRLGLKGLPPPKPVIRRKYLRDRIRDEIRGRLDELDLPCKFDIKSKYGVIAGSLSFSILSVRTSFNEFRHGRWRDYMTSERRPDIAIVLMSNHWDEQYGDCYIVGREPIDQSDLPAPKIEFIPELERYRTLDLEPFYRRAQVAGWVARLAQGGSDFGSVEPARVRGGAGGGTSR